MRLWMAGLVLLWMLCGPRALAAPPPGFTNEIVVSGLTQPMQVAFLPDGRILILEKGGVMWIADPSTIPAVPAPYMTITDIDSGGERGLTSIVLDPDFADPQSRFFYVYYAQASSGFNRISRFTHLGNTGDLGSETRIWQDSDPFSSCCHYGGGLDFGPDGKLYLTTGEEFDPGQAQDPTRTGGSLIRINKDGSIPGDNAFDDGDAGPNVDSIHAIGLRNPFRASWDLETDRLFIAEVGGNNQPISWEDVHLAQSLDPSIAVNYGWPLCEGPCDNPNFPSCSCALHDDPVFAYPHLGANASVSGGVVYRGTQFSPLYRGAYFFGDFSRQFVRFVTFDDALQPTGDFEFDPTVGAIVSVQQAPDGALYHVDVSAGTVRRFVFAEPSLCEVSESRFDGVDDWVDLPDLSFPGDFTVEAWVYLAPGIGNQDAILGQDGPGQDLNFFNARLRLFAPGDVVIANTASVADTWTHYAITRSGTTLRLYVNGLEDATGSWAGVFQPSAIGRGNAGFTEGRIDEVRLWDVERSAAEILANRDTTVPPSTSGLVAYYKFGEDPVLQEVFDATGNDNLGALGSTPVVDDDDAVRAAATAPVSFAADCPACPCLDVDGDADADLVDAARLSRELENLPPPVAQADLCDADDVNTIRTALAFGGAPCS